VKLRDADRGIRRRSASLWLAPRRYNPRMHGSRTDASRVVRVPTADGGAVAIRHRPGTGTPVVFLHGLAVNADLWNLPDVRGPDYEYRSLATLLHERGHDVWLANFRGHGAPEMLSEPPPEQADWSVDHFIFYDTPAVLEHVTAATGRRPFVIGASMGAMVMGAYFQGATLRGGDARPVTVEPHVAAQRQAAVRGAVFVEFPAALRWPLSLFPEGAALRWRNWLHAPTAPPGHFNFPFELLARSAVLLQAIDRFGSIPLTWLRGGPGRWRERLPVWALQRFAQLELACARAILGIKGAISGAQNQRPEILLLGHRKIFDHMKAGVLRQLARSVRAGGFVSEFCPAHRYSDHFEQITLPTLVLAGGRDRIASAPITRAAFFDRIGAADRTFLLFPEIGHGEFEISPLACQKVYPLVLGWIAERDATQGRI
jgi:pimeloyl-ACP methyl ester carboxylesterase